MICNTRFTMMNSSQLDALASPTVVKKIVRNGKEKNLSITYRLMIFYRFILAAVGGYALASLSAIIIAHTFAESRSTAVMSATLIAFVIWACAFIWVFMVNKTLKASIGILLPITALSIIYYFLGS